MRNYHLTDGPTEFYYLSDLEEEGFDIEQIELDYDHLEDVEDQGWIIGTYHCGRKEVHHLTDFLRWDMPWTGPKPDWAKDWHGFKSDTFFSTILVRLTDGGEMYELAIRM